MASSPAACERPASDAQSGLDPSWWPEDLREASSAWRLLHVGRAAACGALADIDADAADVLRYGWPEDAEALVRAAVWTAEAIRRDADAVDAVPGLSVESLQRARRVGLALLGPRRPGASSESATPLSTWAAAAFFTPTERVWIRLHLPTALAAVPADGVDAPSVPKAKRLVALAREAMRLREPAGELHG